MNETEIASTVVAATGIFSFLNLITKYNSKIQAPVLMLFVKSAIIADKYRVDSIWQHLLVGEAPFHVLHFCFYLHKPTFGLFAHYAMRIAYYYVTDFHERLLIIWAVITTMLLLKAVFGKVHEYWDFDRLAQNATRNNN